MRVFLLFVVLLLLSCGKSISPHASLMDLVINGGDYNGEKVIVTGYYQSGLEESALYFSEDQSDYGMIKDAIQIDLASEVDWQNFPDDDMDDEGRLESLSGRYLTMEGVYSKRDSNQVGVFGGSMMVSRVILTRKR